MSKKIKVLLFTCVLAIICCMGFTVGATDEVKAEVKGHSLTITDTGISVNFYVDIPSIEGVQVTLNENEVDLSTMQTEEIIIDAKAYDCYIFTGAVAAKEMDDEVTLSIAAGQEDSVTDSYSVNDYVEEVQKGGYNYNFETLANAMTYYGEFAEVYFGYNGATSVSTNANSYIGAVTESDFDSYAASVHATNMPDGLEFYGTMLNLNSKTTLRLLFTVTDKEASSFGTFTANGEDLGELKPYKTYYYVDIEGIGAAQLDKAYTIKCGDAEIISNCSVLTYARAAVKSTKDSLVNLSKALYLYNQKANTYVEAQSYAVYDMFYGNDGFSATPGTRTPIYLTGDGDVTRQAEGNTEIRTLEQLSGSRTKGASVWMETEYTVSGTEELSGPYVIRRYTGNEGNVLNVTGTATLKTTVNGSNGQFVARYPNATEEGKNVSFGKVDAGEVSVSGTLNVTGSTKTGVITVPDGNTANIVANDLVSKDQVILASHKGVNLSGNADVSAIKLLDDGMGHFDIVKHNNKVRVASVICVCGDDVTGKTSHEDCPWAGENGIAAVYDIPWQAHTATTGAMPGTELAGYYYLVNPIQLTSQSDIEGHSYLDLNGQTITARNGWNIKIQATKGAASYSVTDSQENGKIEVPQDFTYFGYGTLIYVNTSGSTFNMYGGSIDMTKLPGVKYAIVDVNSATFNMYGGEIKGAQTKIPDDNGRTYSNCIETRNSGTINVTGGTIYGEILHQSSGGSLTIGQNAEVGRPLEGITDYGIFSWGSGSKIVCDNINENAKIYIKAKQNLNLSEKTNSNSLVSGFILVNEGKDGHYGVVRKSDGELAFATTICACGKNVSDNPNHTCAWYTHDGNNYDIYDVYDIDWKEHTDNGSIPVADGYYYLTTDVTLDAQYKVQIAHMDLNGHKVICAGTDIIHITTTNASTRYSMSDSKGNGAIQLKENVSYQIHGAVIKLYNSGSKFAMYSGTIDMTNGTVAQGGSHRPIELCGDSASVNGDSGNNFYVYGGSIKPTKTGHSFYIRGKSHLNVMNNGKVYGRVELDPDSSNIQVLRVGDSAKVGLQWENSSTYGIRQVCVFSKKIVCDNLNEDAQLIFLTKDNLVLEENSNSVVTGIKAEDGHFGVIKENGSLRFASMICVCGEDVTGKDSHSCAWTGTEKGIADVYDIPWQAYSAESGTLPGISSSTPEYYYLTNNLTLSRSDITAVETYLDLNGKTIIANSSWNMRLESADANYLITDSKKTGTITTPQSVVRTYGALIFYSKPGTFTVYGGTIDMTNSENVLTMIDVNGGAFFMHGGVMKGAKSTEPYNNTTYSNCIETRYGGRITVTGGTIYGEVILVNSSDVLTVAGNAQVGVSAEGISGNGIKAWEVGETANVIVSNLTDEAEIVFNAPGNIKLSDGYELVTEQNYWMLQKKAEQ